MVNLKPGPGLGLVNAHETDGDTPVTMALNFGHIEIVEHLIDIKADLDMGKKEDGVQISPLVVALNYDRTHKTSQLMAKYDKIIRKLIERMSIDSINSMGKETALVAATKTYNLEAVQALLNKKAQVDEVAKKESQSALQRVKNHAGPAERKNASEIDKLLNGSRMDLRGSVGEL